MASKKTCTIITRYTVKATGTVCCIVRNEQGTEYQTCIHANGHTSCSCKAGEHGTLCYHVKHVQNIYKAAQDANVLEKKRKESAALLAQIDADIKAHMAEEMMRATGKSKSEQARIEDISQKGVLHSARGFSLLK